MSEFGTWTKLVDGFPDESHKYVLTHDCMLGRGRFSICESKRVGPIKCVDGDPRSWLNAIFQLDEER